MTDIELVIKIPEEQYKFIKQSMTMDAVKNYPALLYTIWERIQNGKPLPKGHGRLIDANKLVSSFPNYNGMSDVAITIGYAPTIVEADKGE